MIHLTKFDNNIALTKSPFLYFYIVMSFYNETGRFGNEITIVEDLLSNIPQWRNVDDIVRISIRTLLDALK